MNVYRLKTLLLCCLPLVACSSEEETDGGQGGSAGTGTMVCTPGTTNPCFGVGQCEGAQVCNADGTGYGECDCGTTGGTGGGGETGGTGGGETAGTGGGATGGTGGGETGGSGGTTGGTGGGTTGGAAGTGGGTPTCATDPHTDPLISDFEAGTPSVVEVDGRTGTWGTYATGSTDAASTVESGALHAVATGGEWASTSTVIANGECYDASGYTGISFRIRSDINTSLIYVLITPDTQTDYSHMRSTVTITSEWTSVEIAFADLERPTWGAGASLPPDYDPSIQVVGLGFGVGVVDQALDVWIDDVTFY